jgi:hypothetical protein
MNAMSLLPFVGVDPYVRTNDVDAADVPLAVVCTEDMAVNGGCNNARPIIYDIPEVPLGNNLPDVYVYVSDTL